MIDHVRTFLLAFGLAMGLLLTGCQDNSEGPATETDTIKIGTLAGPETELMEVAKQVAANEHGLTIQIVEFTDYIMPNAALANGSIDANLFQHLPYLTASIASQNYPLVPIGKTFVYPVGIYSTRINTIDSVPEGARVAIPNDPSNEARALLLLEKAGLIKLMPDAGMSASTAMIAENPKKLQILTLDAAQLPRVLKDVTLAVINTNYAIPAGLYPSKDAIFTENEDSLYANIVVVRQGEEDRPEFKKLLAALHSDAVKQAADHIFSGQAIPAW